MRLPDRPVLNGILGVLCALVILALLSFPTIVGPTRAAPVLVNQNAALSSASSGTMQSSLSSSINTVIGQITPNSSSSTLIPQSSSQPAYSEGTGSGVSTSISGSSNLPLPVTNSSDSYSLNTVTSSTKNSNSTFVAAQSTTTIETATTISTPATLVVTSSNSHSNFGNPSTLSQHSSPVVDFKSLQTFGLLSLGSVIIALSCMSLIYRQTENDQNDSD